MNIIYNLIQLAIDSDDELRNIVEEIDELVRAPVRFLRLIVRPIRLNQCRVLSISSRARVLATAARRLRSAR